MKTLSDLKKELDSQKDQKRAKMSQRFFKTGKGEYAQGDIFLGLTVPQLRKIAQSYFSLSLQNIRKLLVSKIHEERQTALFILIDQFQQGDDKVKKEIFNLYCALAQYVNNWDLVDCSADKIVGAYLWQGSDRKILVSFAKDKNLWRRRIGIMATFYFIKKNSFDDTLRIAEILLHDSHDLIHKATGWMLREICKRNQAVEEQFLKKHYKNNAPHYKNNAPHYKNNAPHYKNMPRTMLRYAIERFPSAKKARYTKGLI